MLRSVFYTLFAGYILAYYSEFTFWLGQDRELHIGELILTWLFYSFATYLTLLLMHHFRARSVWAFFLCGALYGWITEGVIVQTMYAALPLSISVTGLQWHALISVLLGWLLIRRWLMTNDRKTIYAAVGIGLFYGLWSTGWWFNAEAQASTVRVSVEMAVLTALLIVAYAGVGRLGDTSFRVTRRGVIFGWMVFLFLFVFAVIAQPLALIVFPLCAGAVVVFLRINKRKESAPLMLPAHVIPLRRLLFLLLIPLIGGVIYAIGDAAGFPVLAGPDLPDSPLGVTPFLYFILMVAGFVMLFLSMWKVWRQRM